MADDRLQLRGLRFLGCHGALPEERLRAQPFEVDLDIVGDFSRAGLTDEIAGTVDYGEVCQAVGSVVEGPHVELVERLASLVASQVLAIASGKAVSVVVVVRKLRPPVPYELGSFAVQVQRYQPGGGDGLGSGDEP